MKDSALDIHNVTAKGTAFETLFEWKCRLDAIASPAKLDFQMKNQTHAYLALFDIDDDTMKLVRGQAGHERPTDFSSTDGGDLYTFRRVQLPPAK